MLREFVFALTAICGSAQASLLMSSPTGAGALDSSIPDFGGAVIDIVWNNGERFNTFLAPEQLLKRHTVITDATTGLASAEIGSYLFEPDWFSSSLITGISKLAIRLSLYDGDNATMSGNDSINGQFQANENFLGVNGTNLGNFSTVETVTFTQKGQEIIDTPDGMTGFLGGYTGVGWFYSDNSLVLDDIFTGIAESGALTMTLDIDKVSLKKSTNLRQENYLSFGEPNKRPATQPKPETPVAVSAPVTFALTIVVLLLWFGLVPRLNATVYV